MVPLTDGCRSILKVALKPKKRQTIFYALTVKGPNMASHPKRPLDPNQLAKLIVDIASGEMVEDTRAPLTPAQEFARAGGLKGGRARADALTHRGARPFRALIDTGATSTMIAPRVVTQLGLQQVNKRLYGGLGGLSWRPGYLFHVAFYETPPVDESDISKIRICLREINGGELLDEHTFEVLLGMDILTTGNLQITKDGGFSFSF
jgi:hypothetical protein